MIKNLFLYAQVVGLAAGVIHLLCKKEKSDKNATDETINKVEIESKSQMQNMFQSDHVEDEMFHAKSERYRMFMKDTQRQLKL